MNLRYVNNTLIYICIAKRKKNLKKNKLDKIGIFKFQ